MKPANFDYVAVDTVQEAVNALGAYKGEAKIIAGGQSLMPLLNFRLLQPAALVDIGAINELNHITEAKSSVRIGALTCHAQLAVSPVIAHRFPVVKEAVAHVAHRAIRNRGTLGGSLAHADPAAELPLMAVLLDAELSIIDGAGTHRVAAADFFCGALATSLADDAVITAVTFPDLPEKSGWGFAEIARRAGDFAIAACAVVLTIKQNKVGAVHIAVGGVDHMPRRMHDVETFLEGKELSQSSLAEASNSVRQAIDPVSDLHASADYRRHVAGRLVMRCLRDAWQRAGGRAIES